MKKTIALILALALCFALAACGSEADTATEAPVEDSAAVEETAATEDTATEEPAELEDLIVGATITPHAEVLEAVRGELEALGYNLVIREYTDYVLPNTSLADGSLDANYFQHEPYLITFNAENGTDLVNAADIHYEPMSLYGGSKSSLDELAEGDTIAIPNDGSNETRALLLLQDEGILTVAEGIDASSNATILDIVDNPLNLEILEVAAENITNILPDVAFAVINGNYALQAGLSGEDALASEAADSDAAQTYANIVAVRAGEENSEKTQALVTALTSETAHEFIESTYSGSVVPIF